VLQTHFWGKPKGDLQLVVMKVIQRTPWDDHYPKNGRKILFVAVINENKSMQSKKQRLIRRDSVNVDVALM
jgi:hypothetical protein